MEGQGGLTKHMTSVEVRENKTYNLIDAIQIFLNTLILLIIIQICSNFNIKQTFF